MSKMDEVDHKALAEQLDYDKLIDKAVEHTVLKLKKWLFLGIAGFLGVAFYMGVQMNTFRNNSAKVPKLIERIHKLEMKLATLKADQQASALRTMLAQLKSDSDAARKRAALQLASLGKKSPQALRHLRLFMSSGDSALKDQKFKKSLLVKLKKSYPTLQFKSGQVSPKRIQIQPGLLRPVRLRLHPPKRR